MRRYAAPGIILGALLMAAPTTVFAGANSGVEAAVRNYFADEPVMINIANCESQFTQFNADGSVLHGGYRDSMIGMYQIAPLHLPDARARGYDLGSVSGNMAYARYLYETYGTSPWLDSRHCWGKMSIDAAVNASSAGPSDSAAAAPSNADRDQKLTDLKFQIARMQGVLSAFLAARAGDQASALSGALASGQGVS